MKVLLLVALMAAVASAQYFCPSSEAEFQCFETKPNTAFCLANGNWVCGKCEVKRASCFGNTQESRSESTCSGAKPSC